MNPYERPARPFAPRGAENEAGREPEREAEREAERTPLRVLIVEDSADDALLLLHELKRGGYDPVHERVDTPEAMEEALSSRGPWDVVVSDYYMPKFRAPDALALLREQGSDVPFVVVSGKVGEELAVEAMRAGAYDYIMKDSMKRLCATIDRGLGEAEVRRERARAEKALRQAEEKYRSIFENSTEGIFQTTTDGRVVTANPMLARMFGYQSPEEMISSISDVGQQIYADPDGRAEFLSCMGRRGAISAFETRAYRKDGSIIWISFSARILLKDGVLVGYEGTVKDITEHKRAEEVLKESEERFRGTFHQAAVGISHISPEGRWLNVNDRLCEIVGYSREELLEKTFREITHPEDLDADLTQARRVLSGEIKTYSTEKRYAHRDGSLVWVDVTVSLVRRPSGEPKYFISVVEDITERKRAEAGLRRSLDRLVALHEAGHLLGSTLEPEELATRLLEIMRRISGLTAAVISLREENGQLRIWRSVGLENLRPKVRYTPELREAREAVLESETPRLFRPSADGNAREDGFVAGLCLPLRVRERIVGVLEAYSPVALAEEDAVAILESLTTQAASAFENARLYGELAEREKRLQELVGKILVAQEEERRRVAYEVHDGLAQVAAAAHQHLQAFAQYHPPQSEESREDLVRVSGLVRQTVGEARRIIADLRPTALDDFGLKSAVRLHLDALRADGWHINYEDSLGDERLPAATETAIFRVMQEALNNVGKHADTKRVDVSLERRPAGSPAPGERGSIRLTVRDYGRGFVPESLANRGDPGSPGERVGMSGMRERIALLGGDFRVASRPGEGTLIVAEVPVPGEDAQGESPDGG